MRRTQNFCEITTLDFSYVVPVKSRVEILWPSQNIWTLLCTGSILFGDPYKEHVPLGPATWFTMFTHLQRHSKEREKKPSLFSKPKQNAISCFIDFLPSLWKHFGIAHLQDPCIIQGQRDYEVVPRILYDYEFEFWWIKKDVIISLKIIIDGGRCLWYKCDLLK